MILQGDCRDVLGALEAESVDACVTDPPYELGFMGKAWDRSGVAYDPETWRAVLRVLKPGAHLLAFGGTRTYHRMACAIEDAGFEIRDQLQWIYGSGFPKSLDVSKAIDKAAGAEREVVGSKIGMPGYSTASPDGKSTWSGSFGGDGDPEKECSITAPATAAARQWEGFGTALKPANEPLVLARKPLVGTVAQNVQAHGTGALNIEAARIRQEGPPRAVLVCTPRSSHGGASSTVDCAPEPVRDSLQRVCAALQPYSTTDIDLLRGAGDWGDTPPADDPTAKSLLSRLYPNGVWCDLNLNEALGSLGDCQPCLRSCGEQLRHVQEAAQESPASLAGALARICREIPELERIPGCRCSVRPSSSDALLHIAALAHLLSGYPALHVYTPRVDVRSNSTRRHNRAEMGYHGGNLATEYTTGSNTGRWPANVLLDEEAARMLDEQSGALTSGLPSGVQNVQSATFGQSRPGRVVTGFGDSGGASRFFYVAKPSRAERGEDNDHPTVKPVDLLRYLIRLVTPPGGVVLDPFAGSGTTCLAAQEEGFRWIACELLEQHVQIIRARTAQETLFGGSAA